jgi:hypothetical protein
MTAMNVARSTDAPLLTSIAYARSTAIDDTIAVRLPSGEPESVSSSPARIAMLPQRCAITR